LDAFPWFVTVAIGPILLGLAIAYAIMRRRRSRKPPALPPDHPARGGGADDRIETP